MNSETKLEDFKTVLFIRLWDTHIRSLKFDKMFGRQAVELRKLVQELGLVDEALEFANKNCTNEELKKWKMDKWEYVNY